MSNRTFIIPSPLDDRIPVNPKQILLQFGLQRIKANIYNFGEDEPDKAAPVSTSYLGTPVFDKLDIIEGNYIDLNGEKVAYEGIFIETVLFDVSQNKNIVKTAIQGRNGTVKEYISDGDYNVIIRGVIASESAEKYPEEEVLKLVNILKVQKEIEVASRYLNDVFNITNLVVESYSFPQTQGYQNIQAFEINCISDDPIELTIRE